MNTDSTQSQPEPVLDPAARIKELEALLAHAQIAELEAKIAATHASAAAIKATAPVVPTDGPATAATPAAVAGHMYAADPAPAPAPQQHPQALVPPQPTPAEAPYVLSGITPTTHASEHYIGEDGVEYIVEYVEEEEPTEAERLGYEPIRLTKVEKWLIPFMLIVSQVWLFAQGGFNNVPQVWMRNSLVLEDALFVASFLLLFAVLRRTPISRKANGTASVAGGLFLGLYMIMIIILCIAKPMEGIAAVVVSVVLYFVWAKWGKPRTEDEDLDDEDIEYVYVDEHGRVIEPT